MVCAVVQPLIHVRVSSLEQLAGDDLVGIEHFLVFIRIREDLTDGSLDASGSILPVFADQVGLGGKFEIVSRESFLLCLDFATGKNLWRHVRSTDAVSEAQESYATPIPHPTKDGIQIIVVGGDYVTAHSLVDGAEIWRCGGLGIS
jgi:outer membrane protein assembly factor BamB